MANKIDNDAGNKLPNEILGVNNILQHDDYIRRTNPMSGDARTGNSGPADCSAAWEVKVGDQIYFLLLLTLCLVSNFLFFNYCLSNTLSCTVLTKTTAVFACFTCNVFCLLSGQQCTRC